MRVLVCGAAPRRGSRAPGHLKPAQPGWTDREAIRQVLSKCLPNSVIIEGEAEGADRLARSVAEELGLTVEPYPANWAHYGKAAGPIRNKQMLDNGQPDIVIYFHDDLAKSVGTRHMVKQAIQRGIAVFQGTHEGNTVRGDSI